MWFSPATINSAAEGMGWEERIDWDDPVPMHIKDIWSKWLSHKDTEIVFTQLHGFSDAVRLTDTSGLHQISLVMSKTKVVRLSIPRLELCGAHLLSQLLHHVKRVLCIPLSNIHAWTDSTVVLNWLDGSPKGNRISAILDLMPPDATRQMETR